MKNLILVILFTIASLVGFSQSTPTLKQVANSGNTAFKKLLYNDNYAGSATGRWLTDKNYVDSLFTVILPGGGISAIVGTSPISVTGGATPTVSITNPIPLANGGTNASIIASDGALFYSNATKGALTATNKAFWDYTNGFLGLGKNSGLDATLTAVSTGTTYASSPLVLLNSANDTIFKVRSDGKIKACDPLSNLYIGSNNGQYNTTGSKNTSLGYGSLITNITGTDNTTVGYDAGIQIVGSVNTAIGSLSQVLSTSSTANTSVGYVSLFNNISGGNNSALGVGAGYNSLGNYNSFWGYHAGYDWTGSNRTFIQAGQRDSAVTIDGNNGQFNITNGHIKIVDGSQGSGKVLISDANGLGTWTTDPSTGTVTNISTGTGLTGGPITSTGTISISTVPVANGGTNLTSYTIGDVLYASGATTLSKLAGVVTGNALISGGVATAPSWGKIGLTTHVSGILPLANGGTNTSIAASNGSVIYSDASKYAMTNVGTAGQLLQSNGATAPSFVSNITPTTISTTSATITTSAVTNPISLNIANHGDNSTSVNSTGALITSDQALTSTGIDVSATSIDGGVANAITASAVNTNSTGYNNGIGAFASGAKYNTAASFAASSAGTTNTGIYSSASGATNNYAALFPAGKVGVGTSTPSVLLDVLNANDQTNNGSAVNVTVTNTYSVNSNTAYNAVVSTTGSGSTNYGFQSAVSGASNATNYGGFFLSTNPATKNYGVYCQAQSATNNYPLVAIGGNVGIGTTTPTQLFQVAGATGTVSITDDGRIYGTAIHNNANSVSGPTNQYICSGTYTPTITNGTNISATTAYKCQWMRVGNVVTVSGRIDIDITTTLLANSLNITLPINSNFTEFTSAGGTANSAQFDQTSNISLMAQPFGSVVQFLWTGQTDTNNRAFFFTFTYLIE